MSKSIKIILLFLLTILILVVYYLFRPLSASPEPAEFSCLDIENGSFQSLDSLSIGTIYGMGLSYSAHIKETAAKFDPEAIPPIFLKPAHTITRSNETVGIPTKDEMMAAIASLDPEAAKQVDIDYDEFSPMMDYEVELGFILLEDISKADLKDGDFIPRIGFFVTNDLSARSVSILGEGQENRYEYWGISKGFPGFLPLSGKIWIPHESHQNGIPCLQLETLVNGERRQYESTEDMIYTPLDFLKFVIKKYPDVQLKRGDIILTGTGGGVAIKTSRYLVRLAKLLRLNRHQKLKIKQGGDLSTFLKSSDIIEVRAAGLDTVTIALAK